MHLLAANIDDSTLVVIGLALLGLFMASAGWMLREMYRLSRLVSVMEERLRAQGDDLDRLERFVYTGRYVSPISGPSRPPPSWTAQQPSPGWPGGGGGS